MFRNPIPLPTKAMATTPSKPRRNICEHCQFWSQWPEQPNPQYVVGDCRRHPPQVFATRDKFLTKFPSTKHNEFCGKFQSRKE